MNDKNFSILSSSKNYDVIFNDDLESLVKQIAAIKNSILFIDQQLENFYPELIAKLKAFSRVYTLKASEENKTLTGAESVLKILQAENATKSTTVIGMGGGIVQDIVSFAAHIYYRGLSFCFVPTTLLAMCDSCIGGKCGLNYHGYKNQLGAFHPPEKVLIWTGFLTSLPEEAIYSGYGEILKLMLIDGPTDYAGLKNVLHEEGFRNSQVLSHIYQGLTIKKRFIEEDEFDTGVRRILNYGHTFGHALELATHYAVPHGLAVARGVDIANYIAYQKGILEYAAYADIHQFIETHFHYEMSTSLTAETLISHVEKDKKVADGKLNMVLMKRIGDFTIQPILLNSEINGILHDYMRTQPVQ